MSPPRKHQAAVPAWVRWPGLIGCGLILVLLGQFQDLVFGWRAGGWQAIGRLLGRLPAPGTAAPAGLSQHSLPLSIIYHLLYAGASIGALHLLLRGRGTWRVVVGFGAALLVGTGLLAAGRAAHWPTVASQGHLLLDFASSPLALLAGYALASFGRPVPPSPGAKPEGELAS